MSKSVFRGASLSELGKLKSSLFRQTEKWSQSLTPGWFGATVISAPQKSRSLWALLASIGLVFGLFAFQLASMQLVQGSRFVAIANGNRIRDNVKIAPRGKLLDRNGAVLTENTASFQLIAHPYLLPKNKSDRADVYSKISKIVDIPEKDIQKIVEAQGLEYVLPVLVDAKVTHDKSLELDLIMPELTGFSLDTVPVRNYVNDAGLSHVLGYVGRVSEKDLQNNKDLSPIDFIGRAGIEQQYDASLRGVNGQQRTEIDSAGRPIRVLANSPSQSGEDLSLTIDIKLQKALTNSLGQQMKKSDSEVASGLVINPKTGEILAMTSLPGYDSNNFARGISGDDYTKVLNDPLRPMFNRAVSSGYPVGSSIKPLVAAAALQEKVITKDTIINDRGSITLVNKYNASDSITFKNFEGAVNGPIKLEDAIAKSSNVFFYTLGGGYENTQGLGAYRLPEYYKKFGLGQNTGIDLPTENRGLVPDPNWTKKYLKSDWFTGDSYNLAIGQGNLQIPPLQLAYAHAALVNGGNLLQPQFVYNQPIIKRNVGISKKHLSEVRKGMRAAVERGTVGNSYFKNLPVKVAGKTGTAETVTRSEDRKPHVWMAAHAPYEDPEILFVGMIENGGRRSGESLGPVAGAVFTEYYKNKR